MKLRIVKKVSGLYIVEAKRWFGWERAYYKMDKIAKNAGEPSFSNCSCNTLREAEEELALMLKVVRKKKKKDEVITSVDTENEAEMVLESI